MPEGSGGETTTDAGGPPVYTGTMRDMGTPKRSTRGFGAYTNEEGASADTRGELQCRDAQCLTLQHSNPHEQGRDSVAHRVLSADRGGGWRATNDTGGCIKLQALRYDVSTAVFESNNHPP